MEMNRCRILSKALRGIHITSSMGLCGVKSTCPVVPEEVFKLLEIIRIFEVIESSRIIEFLSIISREFQECPGLVSLNWSTVAKYPLAPSVVELQRCYPSVEATHLAGFSALKGILLEITNQYPVTQVHQHHRESRITHDAKCILKSTTTLSEKQQWYLHEKLTVNNVKQ